MRLTLLCLNLLCITTGIAQTIHYPHFTVWTRTQIIKEFNDRWSMVYGIQVRRQNNYQTDRHNPFAEPLLLNTQGLLTYNAPNNRVFIHVGQIAYNYSRQLLGKPADFDVPVGQEFRYSAGVELNQEINNEKYVFRQRLMQELRFFKANQYKPVGRVRARATARYQWKSFVSINGITELLFHDPPVLQGQKSFRFNQYWFGASLVWQLRENISLETGYTFLHNRRSTIIEFDEQNIINLHLNYRLGE